ncbi:hypothetical protein [Saccharopolyspora shandongensis]|uniref:hypothetical protein n=1 Tax=Saccharopolyspora shandongensis TaxID=418495 RepID=UPI0033D9468E
MASHKAEMRAEQRARAGKPPRVVMDSDTKAAVIAMLADGHSLNETARALQVSDFRIRSARRKDDDFDRAVLEASLASGRPQPAAPLRPLHCPGSDCGGRGYVYGCRETPCREAHQAEMAQRPRSDNPPLQQFDKHDRYLDELRAGWTVEQAANRVGCEYTAVYYARLTDPDFDKAVVLAAAEGSPHGRPGPKPRAVHQLADTTRRKRTT